MLKKLLQSLGFSKKKSLRTEKPAGIVTHFYGGIDVAIIKFNKAVKIGQKITVQGATTDFSQEIKSMQFDHKDIESANAGQEVGVKVKDKVREGDNIYLD